MYKFVLFKGQNGQYYFNFTASNGERVAQSEGYTSKQSALNGINVIKTHAVMAPTEDKT